MKYHLISDPLCELDEEISSYENCEECPNFYDCMEVEEEMNTYKEIKARMDDLSNDELQALMAAANTTIENRQRFLKKALWEDVIRAIEKYMEAFGDIEIADSNTTCSYCLDKPGIFYITL